MSSSFTISSTRLGSVPKLARPCRSSSRERRPSPSVSKALKASFTLFCVLASIWVATKRVTNFSNSERSATWRRLLISPRSSALAAFALRGASPMLSNHLSFSATFAVGLALSSFLSILLQICCACSVAPPIIAQSGSCKTALGNSLMVSARKGSLPESRKKSMTPADQTSQLLLKLPCQTSGAMYGGVPEITSLRSVGLENISDSPKSTTTTCMSCTFVPFAVDSMTFSGFRSLWMTAFEWQYAMADSVCCITFPTQYSYSVAVIGSRHLTYSARSPPRQGSMTR
mmetsp:Transcript_22297/g.58860  ORF Transcript_22297/g.58860 Transcript_22297/m.58860 type:complete len:286 (-) Transcript_22297:638-1495(-)